MKKIAAAIVIGLLALDCQWRAVAIEPFQITGVSLDRGTSELTLEWNSAPVHLYRVEASRDLGAWDPMVTLAGGPGDTTQFTFDAGVDAAADGAGFFRVAIYPVFPMEMVVVGNEVNGHDPGNTSEPDTYGAVAYGYHIGKCEVTNAQYAEFLNAAAATDPGGLYRVEMGSDARGGITRSGTPGSYTYSVKLAMGDKPVNYVSWYDAARFCNWLHNGRPTGSQDASTTEAGAYTLTGKNSVADGSDSTHGANGRNAGARFWLPGENEWYKAAYHQPAGSGGDADDYWLYPTQSNSDPTVATADAFGNIANDTANIANYNLGAGWNGQAGNLTTVGSGGPGSASFYGAFDMGGNLFEWNEHLLRESADVRGLRGGVWALDSSAMASWNRGGNSGSSEGFVTGFRVAGL